MFLLSFEILPSLACEVEAMPCSSGIVSLGDSSSSSDTLCDSSNDILCDPLRDPSGVSKSLEGASSAVDPFCDLCSATESLCDSCGSSITDILRDPLRDPLRVTDSLRDSSSSVDPLCGPCSPTDSLGDSCVSAGHLFGSSITDILRDPLRDSLGVPSSATDPLGTPCSVSNSLFDPSITDSLSESSAVDSFFTPCSVTGSLLDSSFDPFSGSPTADILCDPLRDPGCAVASFCCPCAVESESMSLKILFGSCPALFLLCCSGRLRNCVDFLRLPCFCRSGFLSNIVCLFFSDSDVVISKNTLSKSS